MDSEWNLSKVMELCDIAESKLYNAAVDIFVLRVVP